MEPTSKDLVSFNQPLSNRKNSRSESIPLWVKIQSAIVLACIGLLSGVTILHWGGEYEHVAVPLMFLGLILWTIVAGLAVQSYFLKHRIGDWLDALVLLWLAYAFYSFTQTEAGFVARMEFMWMWVYAAVFFTARYGIHSRNWMVGWLVLLVAIATACCLYALIHKNHPTHPIWGLPRPDYGARISGTFGCPNHFANLMAMSTFVAFLLGTYSRFPWPLRIFFFYLAGMFTLGIFLSVSRGGYLAWIFGMTIITGYLFRVVKLRWWWKATAAVSVFAGSIITIARNDFVLGRLEQTLSGDIRLQLIVDSIRIWKENKIFGTGMSSFDFYHLRLPEFVTGRAIHTHNDYMNTLSDYGIIGLALVLLFMFGYLVSHVMAGRHLRSEREALLWRIGFCCIVAMAVHEVVDFNLHIPACALVFFSLIGMARSCTFRQQTSRRYWLSSAPLLFGGALFMFFYVTPLISMTWKAQRTADLSLDTLLETGPDSIKQTADLIYAIDSGASESQSKLADILRVQAAQEHQELVKKRSRYLSQHRNVDKIARDALAIYERVHEANPLDDTLLIKKAMTYDSIGQYETASLYYAKALQLRPHSSNFHFAVGHHYLKQGRYQDALKSFEIASRTAGVRSPAGREQVARARLMQKKVKEFIRNKPAH
ncbi:MAG: O-antigen ligase family protein [Verrucomicrobiota bacterium]